MFKRDFYTEIVRVLNIPGTVLFKGGYLIGLYQDGIPYVVDQTTDSKFDYTRKKVVPVSEEIAQETPSVNLADRSDYIFQYKIMFQSNREDEVLTALDAFRTYFFTNKQATIDGYNVSIKTSRGDKLGTRPHAGHFWTFYTVKIYLTAIKNGKIWSDADTWSIRLKEITAGSFVVGKQYQIVTLGTTNFVSVGAFSNTVGLLFTCTGVGTGTGTVIMTNDDQITLPTTYQVLKTSVDTFATIGSVEFSSATGKALGNVSSTSSSSTINYFHNSTELEMELYKAVMNKMDKATLFQLKHTFESETFEYTALISGGARTKADNAVKLFTFNWVEADI